MEKFVKKFHGKLFNPLEKKEIMCYNRIILISRWHNVQARL